MKVGSTKKYTQILQQLQADILSGKYGKNLPFPSEAALMRRFAVSRHTVLRALRELQAQGLVKRRQGAGTFLTRKARETRRIALVIHGSDYCEIFSPIAREVSHLCQARGYSLLLGDVAFPEPRQRAARVIELVREYVKQGVDGVIFQPIELLDDARSLNEQVCAIFDEADIPVVLLDSDIVPSPTRSRYDFVGINHFESSRCWQSRTTNPSCARFCVVTVLTPSPATTTARRSFSSRRSRHSGRRYRPTSAWPGSTT